MAILDSILTTLKSRLDQACENGEIACSERIVSVLAGGLLLGTSIRKLTHSPGAALTGLGLGGALLARGVTGRCVVKGLLTEAEEPDNITIIEHRHFVK